MSCIPSSTTPSDPPSPLPTSKSTSPSTSPSGAEGGDAPAVTQPKTTGGPWRQKDEGRPKRHIDMTRARVIWVGNVPPHVHHDEMKHVFRLALGDEKLAQNMRVTHVTMRYPKWQVCNSATVFLNRSVDLGELAEGLRLRAKRPMLTIRKCIGRQHWKKRRRAALQAREWTDPTWVPPASHPSSPYSVANRAAEEFVTHRSSPPPQEVAHSTVLEFVKELDEGRECIDLIMRA